MNLQVDAGNSVVIEHHMDVIKQADHVIDLGPEGGHKGGELICCGPPEGLAEEPRCFTPASSYRCNLAAAEASA
jgi:excinuclease ABC subunit A